MPNSIKENLGYIKVRDVERDLRNVCLQGGCCDCFDRQEDVPFREDPQSGSARGRNDRVEVIGGGTAVGGSNVNNEPKNEFKNYWK